MATLEQITRGVAIQGILPGRSVTIIDVQWIGSNAINVTYKDSEGKLGAELIYRDREPTLDVVQAGRPWSFDGEGSRFRLLSEARRIGLAHLFDPLLAVHTSLVDPLPHQITAVYNEMLTRQPLRFLLADDPGAGKTIMTGLLIKELIARGDLDRCLIVCPGNLVEQWQDELDRRFHLHFQLMTKDAVESARSGDWFGETPLAICRLDKLSRDEDSQAKLKRTDWDLIVCDEAHKLSATFFGGEIKYTKRYQLGQTLSSITRHFLLLTATPHNGKEADFQLFLALLDGDRFEGRFREGVHVCDPSDMMRRLVKEHLLKFDGTPLFPERRAYTVNYTLSDAEADLYARTTDYVRDEFNRSDSLESGRKGTVGFALTILQRRLASSPEAIYQSIKRRRERLEKRLREERIVKRGTDTRLQQASELPDLDADSLDDLDDAPEGEIEDIEEQVVDLASAARTIAELQAEIDTLKELESLAYKVRQSATDRKWDELSQLLQNHSDMFDAEGHRRKLVIFTEHRDTLNYLCDRIRTLVGRAEAVVAIHGGIGREDRRKAQESFTHDKTVEILVATDAAGEGINLQRAHLMVNYDLPWNPNRLEQRFGRIHRIGQTEVCHLWNLVAAETREGDVYNRLLEKLDEVRKALGGEVFDVLGQLTFNDRPLRELLLEAVRYGDRPDVKAKLFKVVDSALDQAKLRELIENRALTHDSMDVAKIREIRADMERADARRLQPHFIASFFLEAFRLLGGIVHAREPNRYEIKHVPADIRNRDRAIGRGESVLMRYERIAFDKSLINVPGKPVAAFVHPGHPLLAATLDLIVERNRDLLKQGAVLVDENDQGDNIRVLLYLEHAIQDGRVDRSGERRIVSKRMQFVEVHGDGRCIDAGAAPYLDYRPLKQGESEIIERSNAPDWTRVDLETRALEYAAIHLVPRHIDEIRARKFELIDRTTAAVRERLTKEINHWDHRALELKEQERAGRQNAKMNSDRARSRADELLGRLNRRIAELEQERKISPLPPVVVGGAMIVPAGLLAKLQGAPIQEPPINAQETERIERIAMDAVLRAERELGFLPLDVSAENRGYDIESSLPESGKLRFIEVKGRVAGAKTITVTKNEILTGLNKPDDFILAIALIDGESVDLRYVRRPFEREPDFAATSVNYEINEILKKGVSPR